MLSDHAQQRMREARQALRNRENLQHYGDYIAALADWRYIGTVTFRYAVSGNRAIGKVADWLRGIEAKANAPMAWAIAQARGEIGGGLHVHFLVAAADHLPLNVLKRNLIEQFGDSQLEEFDDRRGGAHYLAKNGLDESGDFEFGGRVLNDSGFNAAAIKSDLERESAVNAEDDGDEKDLDEAETGFRRFTQINIATTPPQAEVPGFAWLSSTEQFVKPVDGWTTTGLVYLAALSALKRVFSRFEVLICVSSNAFIGEVRGIKLPESRGRKKLLKRLQSIVEERKLDVTVVFSHPDRNLARHLLVNLRRGQLSEENKTSKSEGSSTLYDRSSGASPRPKRGRPRRTDIDPALIAACRRRGISWRTIAKGHEAGIGTVRRAYFAYLNRGRLKYVHQPSSEPSRPCQNSAITSL